VRDRLSALLGAVRRHHLVAALRDALAPACVPRGDGRTWVVDDAGSSTCDRGTAGGALPVDPPDAAAAGRRCRGRRSTRRCASPGTSTTRRPLDVLECTGTWRSPSRLDDRLPSLPPPDSAGGEALAASTTTAPWWSIAAPWCARPAGARRRSASARPARTTSATVGPLPDSQPPTPRRASAASSASPTRARAASRCRLVQPVLGGDRSTIDTPVAQAATSIATRPRLNTASARHGRAGSVVRERSVDVVAARRDPDDHRRVERERHAAPSSDRPTTTIPPSSDAATLSACRSRSAVTASTSEVAARGVIERQVAAVAAARPRRDRPADPDRTAEPEPASHRDGERTHSGPSPPSRRNATVAGWCSSARCAPRRRLPTPTSAWRSAPCRARRSRPRGSPTTRHPTPTDRAPRRRSRLRRPLPRRRHEPSSVAAAAPSRSSAGERDALLERRGATGHHQPGAGVEHHDVAVGPGVAGQHPPDRLGVLGRVAADEIGVRTGRARARSGSTGSAHLPSRARSRAGGAGGGELVEPVAVHHPGVRSTRGCAASRPCARRTPRWRRRSPDDGPVPGSPSGRAG
jgi:hypothetical protein